MIQRLIFCVLAFALGEGRGFNTRGGANDPMPYFEDVSCTHEFLASLCIKVTFPNGIQDKLVLTRMGETSSIYEGFLNEDVDVRVVMIDTPATKSRLINFNSENVPHCSNFDVDLKADTVKCVRGGFGSSDEKKNMSITQRQITEGSTSGPIVPLGSHYGTNGIPLKVLFTFDDNFYNQFNGQDGKTGEQYMDEVIALVKNAYADASLKNSIGTIVNIIGEKKRHTGSLTQSSFNDGTLSNMALNGGNYNVFTFVTAPGASGVAWGGKVCESSNREKINWNAGYGSNECNKYNPPQSIDCTKASNRIALTSETIAHEIGHNLGMDHDFVQSILDNQGIYQYRKYENEAQDCRGLMDYIDDGVGWSKCSARDFSRYVTSLGTVAPCLQNGKDEAATTQPATTAAPATCTDTNQYGYCSATNVWACSDSRYPWFKEDCKKLCNACPVSTCTDKNEHGYCSTTNKWACTDSRYTWFKEDCAKLCGAC